MLKVMQDLELNEKARRGILDGSINNPYRVDASSYDKLFASTTAAYSTYFDRYKDAVQQGRIIRIALKGLLIRRTY